MGKMITVGPILLHVSGCEMAPLLARSPRYILSVFNLVLDIHVMVNWQLSKKGIRWPVFRDYIAGLGIQLIEATYFLKLSADQFLFFNWLLAQVHFLKWNSLSVYGKSWITWDRHFLKDQLSGRSKIQLTFAQVRLQVTMIQINEQH